MYVTCYDYDLMKQDESLTKINNGFVVILLLLFFLLKPLHSFFSRILSTFQEQPLKMFWNVWVLEHQNRSNHCGKSVRIRSYSGPYSVQMRENTNQNNSEEGDFSHSENKFLKM